MKRIKPVFFGEIVETSGVKKIQFNSPSDVQRYLQGFEKGDKMQATIEKKRKARTTRENAYYWGVVIKVLSEEWGYWEDEVHDLLREQFLKVHPDDGKPAYIKSTKRLSTVEFEDYLANIRMWASSEHGIFVPLPNENLDWVSGLD